MPITLDGTNGITTPTYGGADTSEYLVPVTQFKNRIINGAMGIWQRGTSFSSPAFGAYTVDRFYNPSGSSTSITQSSDVPAGFRFSVSVSGNSGGSNGIAQRIESFNTQDLSGQNVTVSFWAKSSSGADNLQAGLYYANSQDNFGGITLIGSTTITASPSSSWTYYTTTFTSLPSQATNGLALLIFRGSSASSTTLYTGVQLEVGSTATSFDYRPYGTELQLCQRYLPAWTAPGSAEGLIAAGGCANTTVGAFTVIYPVTTRVPPTGVSVTNATHFSTWFTTSVGVGTGISFSGRASTQACQINLTTSGLTTGAAASLGFNSNATSSSVLLLTGCEL